MRVYLRGVWPDPREDPMAVLPDPRQEFFSRDISPWALPFVPDIGDSINLRDGEGWQSVEVVERVFYEGGARVELWIGRFVGWERDDVAALFKDPDREETPQ